MPTMCISGDRVRYPELSSALADVPFYCDITYHEHQLASVLPEAAAVRRWCAAVDQWLAPGDPLLELDTIDGRLLVRIRFRCLLGAIIAPSGQLKSGDIFARVYADGQEIPENYRYCTVERLSVQSGSPAA
jgi:hypothetical protein